MHDGSVPPQSHSAASLGNGYSIFSSHSTPDFKWFALNVSVPARRGISGFNIQTITSNGSVETWYKNGGGGFPITRDIIQLTDRSGYTSIWDGSVEVSRVLNVTVAVS